MREQLLEALKEVRHCGDYGHLWWNEAEGKVWLTMGDSDGMEENGYTSADEIRQRVLAVSGVQSVEFGDEHDPVDWDEKDELDESEGWEVVLGQSVSRDGWSYYGGFGKVYYRGFRG